MKRLFLLISQLMMVNLLYAQWPNGTSKFLDKTFNNVGYDTISPLISTNKVIPLNNNKLLVGALNRIIRYNNNGLIDSTYGTNGVATSISSGNYVTIKNQSSGKTIMLKDGRIERFDMSGNLDLSFGVNGGTDFASMFLSGSYYNSTLEILNNDKIIVGISRLLGTGNINDTVQNFILGFDANGNVDNNFNAVGYIYLDSTYFPNSYSIQASANSNNNELCYVCQKRYEDTTIFFKINYTGQPIVGFGNGGVVHKYEFPFNTCKLRTIDYIQNHMYVSGAFTNPVLFVNAPIAIVFKLKNNCDRDSTFDLLTGGDESTGKRVVEYDSSSMLWLTGGQYVPVASKIIKIKLTNGLKDTTFGDKGVMRSALVNAKYLGFNNWGNTTNELIDFSDIAIQSVDKKIVGCGTLVDYNIWGGSISIVARLDTICNGSVSDNFITSGASHTLCNALTIDSVLGGTTPICGTLYYEWQYAWSNTNVWTTIPNSNSQNLYNFSIANPYTTATNLKIRRRFIYNNCPCFDSVASNEISYSLLPAKPTIVPLTSLDLCINDPVILLANTVNQNNWYNNGALVATTDTLYVTTSGTYYIIDSLQPISTSCDTSLVTTVNNLTANVASNSTQVYCTTTNVQYQWLECVGAGYNLINGASGQFYSPANQGSYAVIISAGTCIDTSNCISFSPDGVTEISNYKIKIYPNPTNKYIHIDFENKPDNDFRISIVDLIGNEVYVKNFSKISNHQTIDIRDLSQGAYFIKIAVRNNNVIFYDKIIKY